jgi:hypothetical protein
MLKPHDDYCGKDLPFSTGLALGHIPGEKVLFYTWSSTAAFLLNPRVTKAHLPIPRRLPQIHIAYYY